MNDTWSTVKEFYNESFGFPEGLVELVAVSDVLLMCVSGSSNETIAKFFDMSIEEIELIIKEYLNFNGWRIDLDFNPYSIYTELVNNGYYSYEEFILELARINKFVRADYGLELYKVCSLYYRYEDQINNQWY